MNHSALGLGLGIGALVIGGGIAWAVLGRDDEVQQQPQPAATDAFASDIVRDFDRRSRNGNFNGAVDIAMEGTRLVIDHSSSSYSSGSRPTSSMTGLPVGSKQGGTRHSVYDATFDGTAMWREADAATGGDGAVTAAEYAAWLGDEYAGSDGTIDAAERARLVAAHPAAFTPVVELQAR